MKVFVKCSAIAADQFTVLPHGVIYINKELEPRLAKRVAVLIQKFPKDICIYEGKEPGLDIKGSRSKELDAEADKEAQKILDDLDKADKKEKKSDKKKDDDPAPVDTSNEEDAEQADAPEEGEEQKENKTGEKATAPKKSRAK